jgi:methionyl aminopeptidase
LDKIKLQHASNIAQQVIEKVVSQLRPGMNEKEIIQQIFQAEESFGARKNWHKPIVRIGANTILSFDYPSIPNIKLQENDIFFIDIGPVVDGYEADLSQSFTMGVNEAYSQICHDSRDIWHLCYEEWKAKGLTGEELYVIAVSEAKQRGYELDLEEGGHRIGPFPHERPAPEFLKDEMLKVNPGQWILEIKLLDPQKKFGAFFESILL